MPESAAAPPDATTVPAPQTDPPPMPRQPMIPRWMSFAQLAGPKMNPTHRLVLVYIASFANEEGSAIVSQDILAYLADCTRQRVNKVVSELKRLKHVSVVHEGGGGGKYAYNVYRLAAADGAVPDPKGTKSQLMTDTKLRAMVASYIQTVITFLEDNDLLDELQEVASPTDMLELLRKGDRDTEEEERESVSMSTIDSGDTGGTPPVTYHAENNDDSSLSPPLSVPDSELEREVRVFHDEFHDLICGQEPGQIHAGCQWAVTILQRPGQLERWRKKAQAAKSDAPPDRQYRTWDPDNIDPAAYEMWKTTAEDLIAAGKMPRYFVEDKLRPVVGVALDDERLVLMAQSRADVDSLNLAYGHFEAQLRRTTGKDLVLDIVVKEWT